MLMRIRQRKRRLLEQARKLLDAADQVITIVEDLSWNEIRKAASEAGINTRGKKKAYLVKRLKQLDGYQ